MPELRIANVAAQTRIVSVASFFPRCGCETAMLQEGVSDHRHECMTVKALP
jgi:hypothetical protein